MAEDGGLKQTESYAGSQAGRLTSARHSKGESVNTLCMSCGPCDINEQPSWHAMTANSHHQHKSLRCTVHILSLTSAFDSFRMPSSPASNLRDTVPLVLYREMAVSTPVTLNDARSASCDAKDNGNV